MFILRYTLLIISLGALLISGFMVFDYATYHTFNTIDLSLFLLMILISLTGFFTVMRTAK